MAASVPLYSAYVDTNDSVFARIMALWVPLGSVVADVTWGRGIFWKKIDPTAYTLHASDVKTGVDCRALPHEDASMDAVVLDPPYMDGFFRPKASQQSKWSDFQDRYGDNASSGEFNHAGVIRMYKDAGTEAVRVCRPGGLLIVKTQDEVSNHKQELTHVQIIVDYETRLGLKCVDLVVVVRRDKPHLRRIKKQIHAKKNHSYFLVFRKPAPSRRRSSTRKRNG